MFEVPGVTTLGEGIDEEGTTGVADADGVVGIAEDALFCSRRLANRGKILCQIAGTVKRRI